MIFQHCCWQIDEYSFKLKNTVSQETYDNSQVDWNLFTNIVLRFQRVNDQDNVLEVDITDRFHYLFTCNGLVVNFLDFGEETFNGHDYFPDWLYTTTISYVFNGTTYTDVVTTGFRTLISRVVYQQTQQSDWKNELGCACNCENHASVLRKWHFLSMMKIAAELCLINQWFAMMKSLYKITRTEHEFADLL